MSLNARLAALERRLVPPPSSPVMVVDVESFEPGPDAPDVPPGTAFRAILRDAKGNTRVIGSLREFYRLTAYPEDFKYEPEGKS